VQHPGRALERVDAAAQVARAAATAGIAAAARQSMACHAGEDGGMCRPRERGDF